MKALTVRQPWAWAIVSGGKNIENRSRQTKHRGPLAIHAGLANDAFGMQDVNLRLAWQHAGLPTTPVKVGDKYLPVPDRRLLVFGAVIGVVSIVDCHHASTCECACSPWAQQDAWHWVLDHSWPVHPPVPASGRLGLWNTQLEVTV